MTSRQSGQGIEDTATAIIQEQDAEVAIQIFVPQGITIIEKAKIAYDAIGTPAILDEEACSCRQASFNTVHTPIAENIIFCIYICPTHCHAVCRMDEIFHATCDDIVIKYAYGTHLRIARNEIAIRT